MRLVAFACAAVALCLPVLAIAATDRDPVSLPSYPAVHQVICDAGKGSAFITAAGKWISVTHVTRAGNCKVDGQPIEATEEDGLDFATLKVALKGKGFKINCDGFKVGTWVFAAGYAGGNEWQTITRHFVTVKQTSDGMRVLLGSPVIPGMSGGPVFNAAGEVVGTVNAFNRLLPISFSRSLKDTSLCPHS